MRSLNVLNNIKIGPKLIGLFLLVGVIPMAAIAFISCNQASSAVDSEATAKLEAVGEIKKNQVESWFSERFGDIQVLGEFPVVAEAIEEFDGIWDEGVDSDAYATVNARFDHVLRFYKETYGYYDLFLFDTAGELVYTVEHEADFATNLLTGEYKDSGLGEAYRGAMAGNVTLIDFESYAPSNGDAASFIAAPVHAEDGSLHGVVALQMPIDAINAIMQERSGLGESGETYLVGDDYLMRSDSRFSTESSILK